MAFARIQAKRELKIPDTVKTYPEFTVVFGELRSLEKEIARITKLAIEAKTRWSAGKQQRIEPKFGLAALGRQLGQPNPFLGILIIPYPMQE